MPDPNPIAIIPKHGYKVVPRLNAKKEIDEFVMKVTCPSCNEVAELDHTVHPDGKVTPSLDCPKCSFHKMVQLEGWAEETESTIPITYPQKAVPKEEAS